MAVAGTPRTAAATVERTLARAARAPNRPPATPRAPPSTPMARASASTTSASCAREAPSERAIASTVRRCTTDVARVVATSTAPTNSETPESAVRLNCSARTMRELAAARSAGASTRTSGGRSFRAVAASATSLTPASGDDLDAVDPSLSAEQLLGQRDVHDQHPVPRRGEAPRRERAGHRERLAARPHRDREIVPDAQREAARQARGNEHPAPREHPVGDGEGGAGLRRQLERAHLGIHQQVHAEHAHRVAEGGDERDLLDHRDHERVAGERSEPAEELLRHSGGRGDLQARAPGHLGDSLAQRRDRRLARRDRGHHRGDPGRHTQRRWSRSARGAADTGRRKKVRSSIATAPPRSRRRAGGSPGRPASRGSRRGWRAGARCPPGGGARP